MRYVKVENGWVDTQPEMWSYFEVGFHGDGVMVVDGKLKAVWIEVPLCDCSARIAGTWLYGEFNPV